MLSRCRIKVIARRLWCMNGCTKWFQPFYAHLRQRQRHNNNNNTLNCLFQVVSPINRWMGSWQTKEIAFFWPFPHPGPSSPPASPAPVNPQSRFSVAQLSQFGLQLGGPEPYRLPMLTRNCLLLFLWFLADEGSVSSSRSPSTQQSRSRTGRERPRSLLGPMRNGAAGFQRVKRGWVWNQFFVLEEYMGSDPQYVGKVRKSNNNKKKKTCFSCYLRHGVNGVKS